MKGDSDISADLRAAIAEVRTLVAQVDERDWMRVCQAEGWTVGLEFCHISLALRRQAGWAERALRGHAHSFDWERTHSLNRLVARREAAVSRNDVISSLDRGERRWSRVLERVTDQDLDRPAFRMGESQRGLGWIARKLAPRHVREHLQSIRSTLSLTQP